MSKVQMVEAIPVSYPEPNDFNALRHLCLVKITTDDGVVGWGESITQFPEANFAVKAIIEGMAERVVGKDPLDNIAIWHAITRQEVVVRLQRRDRQLRRRRHRHRPLGHQGQAARTCRWSNLLGGAVHEKLPAIASCHAHYEDIGAMVEEAQEWVAPGMHGVKVGFGKRGNARLGYEHDRDVEYIRRMREGLGPDQMIMIDCGWNVKWDVMTAVRRVQAFDEYGLHWIEEPLGAWDPEGYANLRAKTTTLIAYGEKEWNVEGFERVLGTGTVDVVGIDPGRAEGITGFKKRDRADRVLPAPGQRALLVVARSARPPAWRSASAPRPSSSSSSSRSATRCSTSSCTEPFEHKDGWVYPPTKPGLGIEIIDEVVDRYRSEKVLAAGAVTPGARRRRRHDMERRRRARGRGVIVTGATGGIGAAVAEASPPTGAKVMAVDLDQGRLDELVGGLRGHRAMSASSPTCATSRRMRRWSSARGRSSAASTCSPTSRPCCGGAGRSTR